jgi:hypothetical protein
MKGRRHLQADTGELEQLALEVAGEGGITVTHYGAGQSMEPNDAGEECTGHRCRRVGMAERDEVRILRKPVDHHEDDRFATNLRECLNKIHGDVCPDHGQNL